MSESQQSKEQSHLLLNILLIVLETVFSFILKNDSVIRLQSKPFVDKKISLRINSYIPYFDFYVQFTDKGVLFDLQAPDRDIDLEISSTLLDLIKIFIFGNRRSIKTMRIGGDAELKEQFKDLLLYFSLPKLFADWKQWLRQPHEPHQAIASKKRIAPLLEKIDTQRSQINSLHVELKQYKNRIRRLQQRQRSINIGFGVITVVLVALLVYNLWAG
ncbi:MULTISPECIES: hypothetical protein [Acinetobacter]|uniref:SCP2 domain-containing protein n=4 Tax=Acinetobacter TaxID=469 RepID=N9D9Y4_9GAMM|nr:MULTISPECIES: hypothetical protein [Acinetobacter]ENV79449.1 hypothetical protein F942_02235 [Acinetobacter ursingii ANC 3649]ENX48863.1 hypothetical protein F943_02400 [Acinetobacter ursingii NIPH 706]EXD38004.1 hypothetical protein J500_0465 [Acinetobacter sp. 479375]MCH2014600.1 hypothetical protein [Acinetobacter ursingii]MCU4350130.1 hypothetical protein [Acinetobacter ursingii]